MWGTRAGLGGTSWPVSWFWKGGAGPGVLTQGGGGLHSVP